MNFVPLKGGEIYNPPDGWFGYGLNVKNIHYLSILFFKF